MSDCYELNVAGVTRQLPIIPISRDLAIASFVILGDCELVTAAAPELARRLPPVDYLVTAEAKGIPLVQELCRLLGHPYYNRGAQEHQIVYGRAAGGRGELHHHAENADFVPGRQGRAWPSRAKPWPLWTTSSPRAKACRPSSVLS